MSDLKLASWFEFDEHKHLFTHADGSPVASVVLTDINDGRDNAVNCMVSVKILFGADDPSEVDPVMEYQRCNLTNKNSANGWKHLVDALTGSTLEGWDRHVQKLISVSLRTWYEGSASHRLLERIDPATIQSPFLLKPFISNTGVTLFYSPGGVGKSMFALGMAVSVSSGVPIFGASPRVTGPVVYVDFEDSPHTHDVRYAAILNTYEIEDDPLIVHYKVSGKLRDHTSRIRRVARANKAVLIVVDSMAKARNASASDADETIKLMNSLEDLGLPVFAIDHVTKSDNKDIKDGGVKNPNSVMAIGSTHSTDGARLGWFLQQIGDPDNGVSRFNVHNTKHNLVAEQKPRSLRVSITNNGNDIMTNLKFDVWDTVKFEDFRAETVEETMLIWMKRNGLDQSTATQLAELTKLDRSSVATSFKSSDWFEKKGKRVREGQFYEVTETGSVKYALLTAQSS